MKAYWGKKNKWVIWSHKYSRRGRKSGGVKRGRKQFLGEAITSVIDKGESIYHGSRGHRSLLFLRVLSLIGYRFRSLSNECAAVCGLLKFRAIEIVVAIFRWREPDLDFLNETRWSWSASTTHWYFSSKFSLYTVLYTIFNTWNLWIQINEYSVKSFEESLENNSVFSRFIVEAVLYLIASLAFSCCKISIRSKV